AKAPFGVAFAAPVGETVDPSEVSIVFNRPMRPLEAAGDETTPPAKIEVEGGGVVRGEFRWLGTSALSFAPETRLSRATTFRVAVPAGTKSLEGEALAEPYSFSFSTARPRLEHVSPYDGETHLKPDAVFDLRFDQPVDLREIERAVRLTAAG